MKKVLIGVAFVLIVGASAFFIFTKTGTTPTTNDQSSSGTDNTDTSQESSLTADNSETAAADSVVTIIVGDNGFSPSDVKVKVGDTITVKNESSNAVQFSSDPHPVHTKNQELNQDTIQAGVSQTFKVTKKGTFGFHDHLNSSLTGTIVVE